MPKKCDHLETQSVTTAEPSAATPDQDAFAPLASDSFSKPTPEQEPALWMELRSLLDTLVGRAATPTDREVADGLLRRLGLSEALNPLFLKATRVKRNLQATIAAGYGKEVEVERLRREISYLGGLTAGDAATNRKQRGTRKACGRILGRKPSLRGGNSGRLSTPPLGFVAVAAVRRREPVPRNDGCLRAGPATGQGVAWDVPGQFRDPTGGGRDGHRPLCLGFLGNRVRPEPAGPRRRYRSTSLSSPSPVSALGQPSPFCVERKPNQ